MSETNEQPKDKLPFDDPRYLIPGTNMFNLSKWTRENEPQADHQFTVGDVVVLTVVTEVTKLTRDVDGTPLYRLSVAEGLWSEGDIRKATDEEADN